MKIFLILPFIGPQKGLTLLFEQSESPSRRHVSCKGFLKLAWWFLRRSCLKEKVDAGQTDDGLCAMA